MDNPGPGYPHHTILGGYMSDATGSFANFGIKPCNFCKVKELQEEAKKRKHKVVVGCRDERGWIQVMSIPLKHKGTIPKKDMPKYTVCWLRYTLKNCQTHGTCYDNAQS